MKNHLAIFIAIFAISACTSQPEGSQQGNYSSYSTSTLWSQLRATNDTKTIMLLEAELASRGETISGSEYIGRRTAGTVGRSSYSRDLGISGDRNCSDFSTPAAAQKFFLSQGGPTRDPHGLDRDGDGNACEWGKSIRSSAAKSRRAISSAYTPRATYSSRCYVGPRGGTYTITASGRKNYSGC